MSMIMEVIDYRNSSTMVPSSRLWGCQADNGPFSSPTGGIGGHVRQYLRGW